MGTRKSTFARILILGCAALFVLGATFTWTGGGTDDDWDNGDNWSCSCLGYPDDPGDDATISGTYDVDLIDECIDDLTVSGTVNFGFVTSGVRLHVDSLTITGPATLTMASGAGITTSACP